MNNISEYVKNISEFGIDKFAIEIDDKLQNKLEEEKLAFLYEVKKELKEIKQEFNTIRRMPISDEEMFYIKNNIKKLKKKIFLINYKIKMLNPIVNKKTKIGMLNNRQKRLKEDIFNSEDISKYDINDQIVVLDYLIIEEFVAENYELLVEYSREIGINLNNYLIYNDPTKEFYIFLNDLKASITKSGKDTEQRNVLKNIYKEFNYAYQLYKQRLEDENKRNMESSSFCEIINYWLSSEDNYKYLKKLLDTEMDVVNAKYDDKHIIYYILDFYIHNFKRMVNDKKSNYVNLRYIEEVYYLFTKNPALKMSKEEKEIIDLKIKKFEEYIDNTLIKQKRKNYAKSICKKMKSNRFYSEMSRYEFPYYNDDELGSFQISITNNMSNYVKSKESKSAYLYDGNIYNIDTKEDGKIIFHIYSISYSDFIVRGCEVDKYLERCEMLKEEVDSFFKKELIFQENQKYPVIDYKLEFYPSGKLYGVEIKKDIIEVKQMNEEIYKNIENLYKKSKIKNNDSANSINRYFENILQQAYIEFLKKENLPFIYYGKTMPNAKEIDIMMNDLSSDLYNMDKISYYKIINIISNEVDTYHYSNMPIHNAEYNLNLLNPISFLGIENQRMLADLYFNIRKLSNKDRLNKLKLMYRYKYLYMVEELNENLGYIDSNILKQSRGKIKKKIRM